VEIVPVLPKCWSESKSGDRLALRAFIVYYLYTGTKEYAKALERGTVLTCRFFKSKGVCHPDDLCLKPNIVRTPYERVLRAIEGGIIRKIERTNES